MKKTMNTNKPPHFSSALNSSDASTASNEMEQSLWQAQNFDWSLLRSLSQDEQGILEKQGNICHDWSLVKVQKAFSTDNIFYNQFHGRVALPHFTGALKNYQGTEMPRGIYHCNVQNSILGNGYYRNIDLLSHVFVADNVWLSNIGKLHCTGPTRFNLGAPCHAGSEANSRTFWMLPGLNLPSAFDSLNMSHEMQREFHTLAQEQCKKYRFDKTIISENVEITGTSEIKNSWIGKYGRIHNALKISDSTLFSTEQGPVEAYDGVLIEKSMLQANTSVHSYAQIYNSVLLEFSSASESVIIHQSIVGANSHLAKGEVIACLLGPFIALHHQSLLISVIWPQGKGNIGYGSKVGSNHTGRNPDQELFAGEGMFFGLGCEVKYPSNFKKAPYTLLSTGVVTSPQKLTFPFSLIVPPDGSAPTQNGNNILYPAWMWYANPYALFRNMFKFTARDKRPASAHHRNHIFSPEHARWCLEALNALESTKGQEVYTQKEIPGLGSNILREKQRQEAVKGYQNFLYFYSADVLIKDALGTVEEDTKESLLQKYPNCFSKEYLKRESENMDKLEHALISSVQKDIQRGNNIFEDYETFHKNLREEMMEGSTLQKALDWLTERREFIQVNP